MLGFQKRQQVYIVLGNSLSSGQPSSKLAYAILVHVQELNWVLMGLYPSGSTNRLVCTDEYIKILH